MSEIEKVTKGSPVGINSPFQKRRLVYLVSIQYRDGTEKTIMAESRTVGFVRDGFVSKKKRDWLFYNTDGELVATKPAKEIGTYSEIGSFSGTDSGFYIFVRPDGSPLLLNGKGEEITVSEPFLGVGHACLLKDGITPVMDGMRKAHEKLRNTQAG